MGILKTIILLLLSVSLFSQIVEKKEYPFPNYCFRGDNSSYLSGHKDLIVTDSICIKFNLYITTKATGNEYLIGAFTDPNSSSPSGSDYDRFTIVINNNPSLDIRISQDYTNSATNTYNFIASSTNLNVGEWYEIEVIAEFGESFDVKANGISILSTISLNTLNSGNITIPYPNVFGYKNYRVNNTTYYNSSAANIEHSITNLIIDTTSINVLNLPLCDGYNETAYDVSGNGNNGIIYGSDYWTTCTQQTYPETYGVSKHYYKGHAVYVPYLLSGSPISTVAINAAESIINYPSSLWEKKYFVKE